MKMKIAVERNRDGQSKDLKLDCDRRFDANFVDRTNFPFHLPCFDNKRKTTARLPAVRNNRNHHNTRGPFGVGAQDGA